MKRYLLFSGDIYYPCGGWHDFVGDFETADQVLAAARAEYNDWAHAFDTTAGRVLQIPRQRYRLYAGIRGKPEVALATFYRDYDERDFAVRLGQWMLGGPYVVTSVRPRSEQHVPWPSPEGKDWVNVVEWVLLLDAETGQETVLALDDPVAT